MIEYSVDAITGYSRVFYSNCPYCRGIPGDTQCIPCYERSMQAAVFAPPPLTEADVRRIVREELRRALRRGHHN